MKTESYTNAPGEENPASGKDQKIPASNGKPATNGASLGGGGMSDFNADEAVKVTLDSWGVKEGDEPNAGEPKDDPQSESRVGDESTPDEAEQAKLMARIDVYEYRAEDGGILDCWDSFYGKEWLFVVGNDCWYRWNVTYWQKDKCLSILKQIETLMDAMNLKAKKLLLALGPEKDDEDPVITGQRETLKAMKGATKRTKAKIASVEGMARARLAVGSGELDESNVLNLKNGTLDLDSLKLQPHSPSDHLTYCLDYDFDPAALAPRFEQFLQEILVNEEQDNGQWVTDKELYALIQVAMGYSLTNDTKHEVMFWLSGVGGNGKSVLIKVVQKLLGINAVSMNFAALGTTDGNYRLADLVGKRVVFCTESKRGGGVAEEIMKQIADGSIIDARPIYGSPFNFRSQSKIWWAMNDRPTIKDTGNAMWRRLKLIPFNRVFTDDDKDTNLFLKLESELSGILNFALTGLRRLRESGRFPESAAVKSAIEQYREESNPVSQWMKEQTIKLVAPITLASHLYNDYREWCALMGRLPLHNTNFGKELKRLQVPFKASVRSGSGVGVGYALGLTIPRPQDAPPPPQPPPTQQTAASQAETFDDADGY